MRDKIETIKNWLGTGSINIFGSPFSGKDTQGLKLSEIFRAKLIGGGDILRDSVIPEHIQRDIKSGELVPIKEYLNIVTPYLARPDFADIPLVLSSVGRWHGEEEPVMQAAKASGHPLKAAVFLELTEDEIWKRWKKSLEIKDRGARTDDTAEALKVRINEYKEKTLPVIDFYRQKGLLTEIDGNPPQDEVTSEIIEKLANLF